MKPLFAIMIIVFLVNPCFAEEVICPQALPGFGYFNELRPEMVQEWGGGDREPLGSDSGHYRKFFILESNEGKTLPRGLMLEDTDVRAQRHYDGKRHIIYLRQVFRGNRWDIQGPEKMLIG